MSVSQEPRQIEREMEVTRSRIDQTIDQIGERVSPTALQAAAQSGMTHARHYVEREAGLKMEGATRQVSRAGSWVGEFIQHHPLAVAAIGVGLGLLLKNSRRRHPELPTIEIKES